MRHQRAPHAASGPARQCFSMILPGFAAKQQPMAVPFPPSRFGWMHARNMALAAMIGFLMALPGLFSLPPLDRDESRFAQASVQMLESGDWVRIRFQNEARNKKPAGIHWLQAASVSLFSSAPAREIWAYRLPSALGAALAAALAYLAGARLFAPRPALLGACLLGASVLLSTEGMIAKTDAVLCACGAGAFAALAWLRTRAPAEKGRLSAIGFWLAIAFAILIKGPIIPGIAALTLIAIGLWEKKWAWMRPLLAPWGPALALAMIAPWGIAITLATEGRFFSDALGGDLAGKLALKGAESHGAPPGLHMLLAPVLSFPITLGLPFAALLAFQSVRGARGDEKLAGARFALAWLIPAWIAFEMAPTKLAHYPLPLYPSLALLAGAGLMEGFAARRGLRFAAVALLMLGALALAGLCAAASALAFADQAGSARRAVQAFMLLAPLCLAVGVWIARRAQPIFAAGLAIALSALLLFTARERIAPEARSILVSQQAVLALRRENLLDAGHQPLLAVGFSEPSLIFSTTTSTRLAKGQAGALLAQAGQGVLLAQSEAPAFEAELASRGLAFAARGEPVIGVNYSKGKPVHLQPGEIVISPAGAAQTR